MLNWVAAFGDHVVAMESIQVESFLQATKVSVDCIPLISLECEAEMFVRVFLVHGRTGKMHIVTKFSTRTDS